MTTASFKDHFSGHAASYRVARPRYPAALYDWLASLPASRAQAWDVGCGSGQASLALAPHFERVIATDPSAEQIANAERHARVEYRVERAEATSIEPETIDLVTVAQALHWFDQPRFYAEAHRVAKPGAVIAVWTYALCSIAPDIDAVVDHLYADIVGPCWPPDREHTMDGYAKLPFPFEMVRDVPAFAMTQDWTLPQLVAYLRTWSASVRFVQATARDPVAQVEAALSAAWGSPDTIRSVRWPLTVKAGFLR